METTKKELTFGNRKKIFFGNGRHCNTDRQRGILVFERIQGLKTQVEKSIKELISTFLEIGPDLSKHDQTDADVALTMQTRYT